MYNFRCRTRIAGGFMVRDYVTNQSKDNNKDGKPIQTSFFYISITTPAFQGGVFDIILLLRLFLSKKDYKQLLRRIFDELNRLENELPSNLYSEVTRKMKLPKDWTSELNKFI